jgi:hypothetical protein
LSDMNSTIWYSNSNIAISFQQAVATAAGNGVQYTDVEISSVADTSSAASRELRSVGAQASASVGSVTVAYAIKYTAAGYSSSTAAMANITAALQISVNSGVFSAYLQAFGSSNGVSSQLSGTDATSLTVVTTSAPTAMPTSSSSSGLGDGAIAAIIVCSIFGAFCIFGVIVWRNTRKIIVVASLPIGFSENDLMVSLPGAVAVRKADNGVCAYVEFETHPMAQDLINRSKRELIYFRNATLAVRFSYPWCFEALCAPSPPPSVSNGDGKFPSVTNPTFGVRSGAHLDEL